MVELAQEPALLICLYTREPRGINPHDSYFLRKFPGRARGLSTEG